MSRVVLELNDQALRLYDENGLQLSSPGYVVITGKDAQFGQQAAEQSRLHPTHTNNEFWHRLGMEPLARPLAHFRHYADVAHAHLMDVAAQSNYHGPVVLAVPGSYDRQQLAILSGVLKHSPFQPQALVDAGLLAALGQMTGVDGLVYVDIQLHQMTLTLLRRVDGQWLREAVQSVQSAGWHTLSNALVQVINDAFIAQCRFNPQHNASWEQHLYNELPAVLIQIKAGAHTATVSIDTGVDAGKARYQARVDREELVAELEPVYRKVSHQLQTLAASAVPVLLSERAALIPGLGAWLGSDEVAVSSEQMAQAGLALDLDAVPTTGQVPYVTRLAAGRRLSAHDSGARSAANTAREDLPTHLLVGHQARRLQGVRWLVPGDSGPGLQAEPSPQALCEIQQSADGVTVLPVPGAEVRLNGAALTAPHAVRTGDTLTVNSVTAQFIQVERA